MKRGGLVILLGLAAAVAAFACVYFLRTADSRELLSQPQPELAWLKREFQMSESEFKRVRELHEAYLPKCTARCKVIAEETARLNQLLAAEPGVTPQVEDAIAKRAKMRSDCETEMLKHFVEVSRTLPPEQGKRYLAWVREQRSLRAEGMEQRHQPEDHSHHTHH